MRNVVQVEQADDQVMLPLFNSASVPAPGFSAYAFKKLPPTRDVCGQVEVYNRTYSYLGLLVSPTWEEIASHPCVVEEWPRWSGGRSDEPGDAVWIDLGIEKERK